MINICPLCGGELRILTGNAYCKDCNTVFKYKGNLGYIKIYVEVKE